MVWLGVRSGFPATWRTRPPPPFNQGTSLSDLDAEASLWWLAESRRLESMGALRPIAESEAKYVSRCFLVPKKKPGDYRMVVDLRHVNEFAVAGTAEVETLRTLQTVARPGDWMTALDLSDGYYHFRLRPEDARFFQIATPTGAYTIEALNMGWTRSPEVFTDALRPAVRWLRARGVRLLWYLDDFLICGATPEECAHARDLTVELFRQLGLLIKREKCVWTPTQQIEHLGMLVDTVRGEFRVTDRKLEQLRSAGQRILAQVRQQNRRVQKRELASLVGLAIFCYPAVPPARFYARALYDCLGTGDNWNGRVIVSRQAVKDVRWWMSLASSPYNGGPIWQPTATVTATTDASLYGWGGTIEAPTPAEARGFWTVQERGSHINCLELRAVARLVDSFVVQMARHTVRLKCDNLATVHVINSGTSRSPALMTELRSLYRLLDRHRITLKVEYIASRDNVDADRLSRHRDTSDWQLTRREFLRYGKGCTIDRFGSATNAQLPRFNSAWHCPGTSGVDAFAQPDADWRKHHNWCNPPWVLLDRLSRHLQHTGASAVVAAPAWDHTPWHSLLRSLATRINRINAYAGLFTPGRDLPARHIRAPRWDVDVFTIPRRAPQRSFEDELPGLARFLRA